MEQKHRLNKLLKLGLFLSAMGTEYFDERLRYIFYFLTGVSFILFEEYQEALKVAFQQKLETFYFGSSDDEEN